MPRKENAPGCRDIPDSPFPYFPSGNGKYPNVRKLDE
jgi:hypothetical protein